MDKGIVRSLELAQKEKQIVGELELQSLKKNLENRIDEEAEVDQVIKDLVKEDYVEFTDDEKIKINNLEDLKLNIYGDLETVYDVYKDHFYIGDTKKIDIFLATALSQNTKDKNVWLLFVGASGIGKSMLTDPIRYVEINGEPLSYMVSDITTNTLVSGMASDGVSLAPELDGKITYVPDFSTIVEKRSEDQREIFSQFRNLYDGFAKKDTGGFDGNKEFKVDTTVIGNVTPAIHNKNLIHQSMGTRFLYYDVNDFSKKEVFESIWNDEDTDGERISRKIASVIESFIEERKDLEDPEVPENVKEELQSVAEWTAKMRATGQFDRRTNELRGHVHPEKPTRILKQFKKLYYNLKKLSEDYEDERAIEILSNVGSSCVSPSKRQIYIEIDSSTYPLTIGDLVDRLGISRPTIKRRLLEMRNVGILDSDLNVTESGRLEMSSWNVKEDFEGYSDRFS